MTFPDGYEDRLILWKHYLNEEDRLSDIECNYIGHLSHEINACVAMTGCLGLDDIELTILSTHIPNSIGFIWTKEGKVHMINVSNM